MDELNKPTEDLRSADESMNRSINTMDTQKIKRQPKKPIGKIILFIAIGLILIGVSAGGTYWWRNNTANQFENKQAADITSFKSTITSLEKQLADEKAKTATGTTTTIASDKVCTPIAPSTSVIENIEASITSGNTAALEGYMASSVNVVLAASGGVGVSTPTQAVAGITDFMSSDISSWDFDFSLSDATLKSYSGGGYGKYFPSIAVVGKATNSKVISFSFDCNGKINTVFMAANENLLK